MGVGTPALARTITCSWIGSSERLIVPRGSPRTTPDVERLCKYCSNPFIVRAWERRIYCDRECWRKSRKGFLRPDLEVEPDIKLCPMCGNEFLAGGGGRKKRTQVYCSTGCSRTANTVHGVTSNSLTLAEAGYIAGFIDGEGHLTLVKRESGSVAPRLFVGNTHKGVIEWLRDTVGAGSMHSDTRNNEKHAVRWNATFNAAATESLLRQIRPYMIVKAEQADLVLEFQQKKEDPSFRADKSAQGEYHLAIKKLNKTGPKAVPA